MQSAPNGNESNDIEGLHDLTCKNLRAGINGLKHRKSETRVEGSIRAVAMAVAEMLGCGVLRKGSVDPKW